MHRSKSKTKVAGSINGFTLIELLVVIAIISLLSSIIFAVVQDAKNQAYYAVAAEDEHTIQTAIELYYNDRGDYPVPGELFNADSAIPTTWNEFGTYLQPYLSSIPYPRFPSINGTYGQVQGYAYIKGTESDPQAGDFSSNVTGQITGCIIIYDGYYLDFDLPVENSLTLGDNGPDPDGIELSGGHVVTYTGAVSTWVGPLDTCTCQNINNHYNC